MEENDERPMTEVNSRKGGHVLNKEKYPMSNTKKVVEINQSFYCVAVFSSSY